MFFTCIKKYSKEQFVKDLVAGMVFALPGIIKENRGKKAKG